MYGHIDYSSKHLDTQSDLTGKGSPQPRSIEDIMKCTRFSKSEIRLLYRGFKQVRVIDTCLLLFLLLLQLYFNYN
jgi:hypothetical protein